ncbi:MAG: amino acid adenylation domain-containing protein, partial [Cyanobacteria bacterium J06634_6]
MVNNRQTLQRLQQRISSLSPAQQQLFRQQLAAQGIAWDQVSDASSQQPSRAAIARPQQLPLSASQKHLWVLHQLYPDTTAYHISLALTIQGELVVEAMQRSLQDIITRHESLRLVIAEEENRPYLKVLPSVELDLSVIDLSTTEDKKSAVTHWEQRLSQRPFDLKTGPLIRARLLQLEDNRFELILILHHLIADGWSRGILLKELALNYQQHVQNSSAASLPALTFQYPDYVLQQQQWLGSDECQQQRNYWKQQLAGLTELNLPIERSLSDAVSDGASSLDFASQTCTRTFSVAQTQSIKALAKQSGATVFMVLLAIFKLLLHRYSGQRDIAVGIPVAGRNTAAVEPLIGFFVNTLVLRTNLDSETSQHFSDWLQQVRLSLADALQHQDIPFSEVVEAVGATRIPGKNPLFRVMFQVQSDGYQLQNAEQLGLGLPGLRLTQRWIEPDETKFDMSWHVIERDGSLLVAVEYRTGLFEGDRIQHMLDHFHTLTNTVIAAPTQEISQFSLLSSVERETILNKWSKGAAVEAPALCFPARFEQQVKQTAEAIAVVSQSATKTKKLTYQQLNQRANKLAHWLRNQGVGPNVLVGVCVSVGVDLMTALLAILKAGGAYIPLDPTLPNERLRYMVRDAKPAVLIAHSNCVDSSLLKEACETSKIFYLDKDEQQLISQPGHNLSVAIQPSDLAYIIYTSGSTGKPKGTQLTHGGLINYLNWCLKAYPVTKGIGAPVQSSVGFDATITSLFSPLLAGKQVVFTSGKTEIESLQASLSDGFSFIKLTPAHLSALQPLLTTQQIDRERLPSAFIIGGEALKEHHISFWREHYPEIALINEYGPTEAVVGCCVHRVTQKDSGNIPIGRPIDGAQLYVLDESQQPVPAGIPGELYIGGAGVARGYLNQPELTTERFVTVRFQPESQQIFYKTGDLAAYRPDGTLEYLGRADAQIKLRGFRIEPGEIEAALCQCEQIEQAVVVLREEHNRRELVAYITGSISLAERISSKEMLSEGMLLEDFSSDELRQQLSKTLPSYMVPSHFVMLDELPLTHNGKIDRRALPAPSVQSRTTEKTQPRDRKEEILLKIWQKILGRDDLSIHDNFFDLGGDSIS